MGIEKRIAEVESAVKCLQRDPKIGPQRLFSVSTHIFVLIFAVGATIDNVRVKGEQAAFDAALDSAALAVAADDRASLAGLSATQATARIAELEAFAREYMAQNYTPQFGNDREMDLDIAIEGSAVDLKASHDFPTTILSLTGIDEINLTAHSQIMKAMRPMEIALVMDTTGSMATNDKITGAKNAARQLLDTVYGGNLAAVPESEYIRVALVPFAAAVRLNENAYDFDLNWIDTKGLNPLSKLNFNDPAWNNYLAWSKLKTGGATALKWNGCVESRAKGTETDGTDYSLNDVAPAAEQPATLFPAYFAPDAPSIGDRAGYPEELRGTNWTGSYIPEDAGKPNEITGLKKNQAQDLSNAGLEVRQENQAKYNGRVIDTETNSASPTGPWTGCSKSPIIPMTYLRANIDAGITAMSAAGSTLIAEGISWGFRALSPSEPFTKVEGTPSVPANTISTYNHPRWQKIMVLMTDGDNDLSAGVDELNGTVYSAYGRGKEVSTHNRFGSISSSNKMVELDNAMTAACIKVKAAGIELYVTSFGSGVSTATRAKLQACATDADNYKHASSSSDLSAFFNHIGQDLLNKSIYVSE